MVCLLNQIIFMKRNISLVYINRIIMFIIFNIIIYYYYYEKLILIIQPIHQSAVNNPIFRLFYKYSTFGLSLPST